MTQRTSQQNKSLHVWCERAAEVLNEAGLDMKTVLKPEVDIPWTKDSVKNHLWRPVQEVMMDKASTTELDTVEPDAILRVISRHLASKLGVALPPWPSIESQSEGRRDDV